MKQAFASNVAWSAGASWVEQATAALIFLVIARIIGVDSFGIASMAFAFLFLGEFLVRDTITEAIVERDTIEPGRLEATFVVLTGFAALVTLALWLTALLAARLYDEPLVAPLLITASPTVLMIALAGVSTALLRRRMAYRALAIRTISGVVAGGIVGVTMAVQGFGAWSLVGQRLTEIGINSLLAFSAAGWRPERWPGKADVALVAGLGPRVVRLRATTLVIAQTPTVMLGLFAGSQAAGLFAFALRLSEIVLTVTIKPVQGVAQSALAEIRRQGNATAAFFLDLTELAALAGFVAFTGLALVATPLAEMLLGPDWHLAGLILPWLCLANAGLALSFVQEAYLLAHGRPEAFLRAAMIEAGLGLAIIALAAPYGPVATAAAVALRVALALPLRSRAALAPETIAPAAFLRALLAPLLVACAMGLVVGGWRLAMFTRIPDPAYLASAVICGAVVVAVLLAAFMPALRGRLMSFLRIGPRD